MSWIELTDEMWVKKYKPNMDGDQIKEYCWYADKEFLNTIPHTRIWTLASGDDNTLHVSSGWRRVNRLGIFVTEERWKEGDDVYVEWLGPNWHCDGCQEIFEGAYDDCKSAIECHDGHAFCAKCQTGLEGGSDEKELPAENCPICIVLKKNIGKRRKDEEN